MGPNGRPDTSDVALSIAADVAFPIAVDVAFAVTVVVVAFADPTQFLCFQNKQGGVINV